VAVLPTRIVPAIVGNGAGLNTPSAMSSVATLVTVAVVKPGAVALTSAVMFVPTSSAFNS
jgi:hypothetical protein